MSVKIPDDKLIEVREASDIVEVIGEYVQLKKQGRQYGGLCPFHDEKTPSFSVSEDKQVYHCFGCGAGGNVFTFLQELEGWTFSKTVYHLAERAKIHLETQQVDASRSTEDNHVREMKEGHELAASTYHSILLLTEEGAPGRVYAEERNFTQEQLDYFRIGYALNEWETLAHVLKNKGFDLSVMEAGGLVAKRKSEGYYDLFRSRLIVPITDSQGSVVAFGGRQIGEGQPKYLNSPETPIFQKAKTLFHMYEARPSIRKQNKVYLFEGAFDVMAAWQTGITNSVATLGTALSVDHAKLLRRNAEEAILCFDGDNAGREAIKKAIPVLQEAGCQVQVCVLPDGYDPDDYIKEFGEEAFRQLLNNELLSVIAFRMYDAKQGKNMQNEGERLRYIEEMIQFLAGVDQSVERDYYLRRLSEEFQLPMDVLQQELERKNQQEKQKHVDVNPKRDSSTSTPRQPSQRFNQARPAPAHIKAERILLAYMLQDEEMVWRISEKLEDGFNVDEHQALYAYLLSFVSRDADAGMQQFVESLEDQKLAKLAAYLVMLPVKEECTEEELDDYIKRIEQYPKWVRIKEQQQAARLEQDPVLAAKQQMELIRLKKELQGK
ncbi:DNA primase [Shouchella patagoniensis]|uniref:DNA primase n=1 Tax=Shouchella patagoniensis TaxID=228576 RepID=UPI0009957AA1|nr:DNA primase [Shouchella patagoniensis]